MIWNGASCFEFDGKSMETEKTTWSEFPNGGKAIVEQILASQKKKEIKASRTVRVTVRNPRKKVNHQSKVSWDKNILTKILVHECLEQDTNIIKHNHGEKSMKAQFVIYAGTESLIEKIDTYHTCHVM